MLTEQLEVRVIDSRENYIKVQMPITDRVKQPFGFLHGGATISLCDTAAQLGTETMTMQVFETRNINIHHLASAREGVVTAEAQLIHQGKSAFVWEINVYDERQKQLSRADCTIAILV